MRRHYSASNPSNSNKDKHTDLTNKKISNKLSRYKSEVGIYDLNDSFKV